MKCVILQPSYIPWRGFFHQIAKADLFVFYDDVQYDKRGWRNRNRIKTSQGSHWLTIPVHSSGAQIDHTPINQIHISWDQPWNQEHMKALHHSYTKAPYFKQFLPLLEEIYNRHDDLLSDFTIYSTIALAHVMGNTHTKFINSSELAISGAKTDHLISILKRVGADHYISGPAARDYIEEDKFKDAGISLEYMSYNYPEYSQLYPPFDPQVSILDLLFMTGTDALKFIL
jgi:WbqC-like protein family